MSEARKQKTHTVPLQATPEKVIKWDLEIKL